MKESWRVITSLSHSHDSALPPLLLVQSNTTDRPSILPFAMDVHTSHILRPFPIHILNSHTSNALCPSLHPQQTYITLFSYITSTDIKRIVVASPHGCFPRHFANSCSDVVRILIKTLRSMSNICKFVFTGLLLVTVHLFLIAACSVQELTH